MEGGREERVRERGTTSTASEARHVFHMLALLRTSARSGQQSLMKLLLRPRAQNRTVLAPVYLRTDSGREEGGSEGGGERETYSSLSC